MSKNNPTLSSIMSSIPSDFMNISDIGFDIYNVFEHYNLNASVHAKPMPVTMYTTDAQSEFLPDAPLSRIPSRINRHYSATNSENMNAGSSARPEFRDFNNDAVSKNIAYHSPLFRKTKIEMIETKQAQIFEEEEGEYVGAPPAIIRLLAKTGRAIPREVRLSVEALNKKSKIKDKEKTQSSRANSKLIITPKQKCYKAKGNVNIADVVTVVNPNTENKIHRNIITLYDICIGAHGDDFYIEIYGGQDIKKTITGIISSNNEVSFDVGDIISGLYDISIFSNGSVLMYFNIEIKNTPRIYPNIKLLSYENYKKEDAKLNVSKDNLKASRIPVRDKFSNLKSNGNSKTITQNSDINSIQDVSRNSSHVKSGPDVVDETYNDILAPSISVSQPVSDYKVTVLGNTTVSERVPIPDFGSVDKSENITHTRQAIKTNSSQITYVTLDPIEMHNIQSPRSVNVRSEVALTVDPDIDTSLDINKLPVTYHKIAIERERFQDKFTAAKEDHFYILRRAENQIQKEMQNILSTAQETRERHSEDNIRTQYRESDNSIRVNQSKENTTTHIINKIEVINPNSRPIEEVLIRQKIMRELQQEVAEYQREQVYQNKIAFREMFIKMQDEIINS